MKDLFLNPPREFGFMPLWFWNDDLQDPGTLSQIREFHAKGFGGFIIHPRNGLSRRIGYLTEEFFRLVKVAVSEAARLEMKVVIYDEAGYPAGSARGQVVAQNPDWAAKCLFSLQHRIKGPAKGYWRPNPGRALGYQLVSVVLGREAGEDTLAAESMRCLEWDQHELVPYDLPAGDWRLVAMWEGHSGGNTRGAFAEEEDGHALAPPAADILREDVVSYFIKLTHDEYYHHLKEFFGSTIVAMFTDEPTPQGRIFDPVLRVTRHSWTPGFQDQVQPLWDEDVKRWLPALWLDCGPRTSDFRAIYRQAVQQKLNASFYKPISDWCESHGIALTGHVAHSNEMGTARHFQWPGQDLVWRMVVPDSDTAITGADSLTAKSASSAARLGHRRFNAVELFGAYGWQLTFDDIKWLLDWHFVRGTNLIFPHAAFYSIRGRRAFESEPDIAVNNVWWPYFGLFGDYGRRLCWLFSDGEQVCETGVLSNGDDLAWAAAAILHQTQQDFIFIDDGALAEAAVENGCLNAGSQRLRLLILDQPGILSKTSQRRLAEFESAGGTVIRKWTEETLPDQITDVIGCDVEWLGDGRSSLRAMHYRKNGADFFYLVNEGEGLLDGQVLLRGAGGVERWDALDGSTRAWPAEQVNASHLKLPVRLERREAAVFAIIAGSKPEADLPLPRLPGEAVLELKGPWVATAMNGDIAQIPLLGDWARTPSFETFSGTLCYQTTFELKADLTLPRYVDLGGVGDIAEVWLNGVNIGFQGWAPYRLALGGACQHGVNKLEVRVTNSMANTCDGRQLPSGLLGPVRLMA